MATQQEVMEQAKEFLRLVIKYRFWISIGVAALFALIAYGVGAGPMKDETKKATDAIVAAEKEVKQYTSNTIPTDAYKPIVLEKTGILEKDVNAAWKTLFDRQADLLTWPDPVQDTFRKWGRKYPEGVDPGTVALIKDTYIQHLPAYVTAVYKSVNPFDYETGGGIVVTQGEAGLLQAPHFRIEDLPDLGKIWSTQERLWIQRAVLEVIAQVNKNARATNWDGAIIKEIVDLDVGTPLAQDQKSMAKGETLEEAAAILGPGETPPPSDAPAGGSTTPPGMSGGGSAGGQRAIMMSMGLGRRMEMGGGFGGSASSSESVYYVKPADDKGQYKILPILVSVLIDQDRIQDFLTELENSPMSIQVKDFELKRPAGRVTKPEKGTTPYGEGGEGGMYGGGMMQVMMSRMSRMNMGMGGKSGYGGQMMMMQSQMMARMKGMGGMGGMGMMGGVGGLAGKEKKGQDVRNVDRKKKRAEEEKAASESRGPSWFDPYFDVVDVTVYGQARFFLPPPVEAAAEPSPGQTAAAPAAGGTAPPAAASPAAGAAPPAAASPAGEQAPPAAAADSTPAKAAGTAADAAAKPAAEPEGAAPQGDDEAAKPAAAPKQDAGKAGGAGPGAPQGKPETKAESEKPN
jgi:hypothetical protein